MYTVYKYKTTWTISTFYQQAWMWMHIHTQLDSTSKRKRSIIYRREMKLTCSAAFVVIGAAALCMGYNIDRSYRVYYSGEYINTAGAVEAASQSAHRTAQSIFLNFYNSSILRPGKR